MDFNRRPSRLLSAETTPTFARESGGAPGHGWSGLKVGVVRNPGSHRNKTGAPYTPPSSDVLLAQPRTRAELEVALKAFAGEGLDILVVDGGDGTIRDVLTCGASVFGTQWPRLVVLPKGKTNALALDLGVPDDWTLDGALAAARSEGEVRRRPLVVEREGAPAQWGFIFGTGAFNAAIATGQTAHRLGAFQSFAIGVATALGIVQAMFGLGQGPWRRTAKMRLRAEPGGVELPHSGRGGNPELRYLALFSTLRKFPMGIRPFRASERDIRYLVFDAPLRRVTAMVPAILAGADWRVFARFGVHRGCASAFSLVIDDRYVLDGEVFPPGSIRLRQGLELRFIVP